MRSASTLALPHQHICIVTQQLKRITSGPGIYSVNLVNHLLQDGYTVTVIAPENQKPAGELAYTFIGVPPPLFHDSHARWLTLSWAFGQVIRRQHHQTPFDLIHFTDAHEALFTPQVIPSIGNVNDTYSANLQSLAYYRRHFSDWLTRWLYYAIVHQAEALTYPRLSTVIANSQFTSDVIRRNYPQVKNKLITIYKSVNPAFFQTAAEQRKMHPPTRPVILFVGSNMQRKGLPDLLRAAPAIIAKEPATQFWVVGEDKAIPNLQKLARQIRVSDHFLFMGNKSHLELQALYAQASVFVLPSLTEALGVAILEAMAAGVPVTATQVGGIPEIITNEQNGLLVPPNSPEDLAQAIVRILQNPHLANQLTQAGLKTANQFSVETMMAETYQVYARLLQK